MAAMTEKTYRFGIGERLWAGMGILCVVVAVIAGATVFNARLVERSTQRMVALRVPVATAAAGVETNLYATLAALRGYLLTNNPRFKADRADAWARIGESSADLGRLSAGFTNPRNVALWHEAEDTLAALRAAQDKVEALGPGDAAVKLLVDEAVPKVARLVDIFEGEKAADGRRSNGMIDNQRKNLAAEAETVSGAVTVMVWVAWLSLVAGIGLAVGVALLTNRAIVPPVRRMTAIMGRLADGDLAVAVPDAGRKDEIGAMAEAMEVFRAGLARQRELEAAHRAQEVQRLERAERVAGMTKRFDEAATQMVAAVASASTQLQGTAGAMRDTAFETSQRATAVAAAAEEASVNVQTVASAAEELAGSINEISRQVDHSSRISSNAVTEAGRAEGEVGELAVTVQKIGDVVKLINDIASQTTLLALNATMSWSIKQRQFA